jgi:hypothetical protein
MYLPCHRVGTRHIEVEIADFWRTFHHDGKSALTGEGGGCTPTPFTLVTITYKVAVYARLQLRGQIHSTYFNSRYIYSVVSAISVVAYTTTLYVMVYIVKGGGSAPPHTSLGCFYPRTPESGHSVYSVGGIVGHASFQGCSRKKRNFRGVTEGQSYKLYIRTGLQMTFHELNIFF